MSNHTELATLYCDESGNTGPDLLSKTEPFFVYAWVLLTKEQEAIIENGILDLLKRENLPPSYELHSVTLWQSARGRNRWNEVFQILRNSGATVFIAYSEKVFELCVYIVESYLDPEYNTEVRGHLLDIEFRRLLINAIMKSVSEDLLKTFLRACNTNDAETLKDCCMTLGNLLALHPDNRIAEIARVIIAGKDNFYQFGQRFQNAPANMHLLTSHITLFNWPLIYINEKLDTFQLKARLVRDQDSQFGEVLNLAYNTLQKPSPIFNNIVSSEEGVSSQLRGLQIADLAAGITARVLKAKYMNHNLKPNQWAIWKSLRGSLILGSWSYQLTSDKCEQKLLSLWNRNYPNTSWFNRGTAEKRRDLAKCSCGYEITSRNLRDFYLHVLESHPHNQVIGTPCRICKELIPFGLDACHEIIDHDIKPPFHGDLYGDIQSDYEVLKKTRERKLKVVEPK